MQCVTLLLILVVTGLKELYLPSLVTGIHYIQCFCKQCYPSINPCGYWTQGTLFALVSNQNTLYNVIGVKTHLPVNLPQSVTVSVLVELR